MTQCTPIRTRRGHFSTPLNDLLWNRDQDRQSSYIAAEEAAKALVQEAAQARQLLIDDILTRYSFSLDEYTTLHDATGAFCYQVGMNVVSKSDCSDCYLVIAELTESGEEWRCVCPSFRQENGPLIITAVQQRRERKRQQRLQVAQSA